MRLAFPWALLLLVPLLIEWIRKKPQMERTLLFPSLYVFKKIPKTLRQRFEFLPKWFLSIALLLLIFSAARPQRKERTQSIPREGVAIELVVDISTSMNTDLPVNSNTLSRMEVSKKVLEEFIKNRPNDLIGLITFARFADTICPMTLSHDSLLFFVKDLAIEERENEDGTAFGDAVALAAARLKTAEERYQDPKKKSDYTIKSKVIILLTDGDNNCGRHLPMEAAALAKKWGIRLHTIAITDPPEIKIIKTPNGPVKVKKQDSISAQVLARMAEVTGGIFRQATDNKGLDESLNDIYHEIDEMEKTQIQSERFYTYTDLFMPFTILAFFLLLFRAVLLSTWLRRIP